MVRPAILTIGLAIVTFGGVRGATGQLHQPEPSEWAAIEALWLGLDSAWNARDAERFGGFFADDVSFEFVDRGESFGNRAAVYEHFSARFQNFADDLRHRTTVRSAHLLAKGVYAVDGTVEILRATRNDTTPPQLFRTFAISAILTNIDSGYNIHLLRIYQLPLNPERP